MLTSLCVFEGLLLYFTTRVHLPQVSYLTLKSFFCQNDDMTNPAKVWALLIALSISFLALGHSFFGRPGLFFGLLIALGINFLVFAFGDSRLVSFFKGRAVRGQDGWGLIEKIAVFAHKASIPQPTLFIIPLQTPTAFALGHTWHNSAIVLSQGLIDRLSDEEVESVLALEIAKIKSLDTFASGVTHVLGYALLGLGRWLDYLWIANFFSRKNGVHFRPFSSLFYPFAWVLIRLTISPQALLLNDTVAAQLIGDARRLAETLWKLESYATTRPFPTLPLSHHLFVVSPLSNTGPNVNRKNWFTIQPLVEQRIRNLVGYYPI